MICPSMPNNNGSSSMGGGRAEGVRLAEEDIEVVRGQCLHEQRRTRIRILLCWRGLKMLRRLQQDFSLLDHSLRRLQGATDERASQRH